MGKIFVALSNPKAESFYDPHSKVDLVKGKVVAVEGNWVQFSTVLKEALAGGHIKTVTEAEFDEADVKQDLYEAALQAKKEKAKKKQATKNEDEDADDQEDEDEDGEEVDEVSPEEMMDYLENEAKLSSKDTKKYEAGLEGDKLKDMYNKYKQK